MSDDDDYVEALSGEDAIATSIDDGNDDKDPSERFESSTAGGPVQIVRAKVRIPVTQAERKVRADMIAKFAAERGSDDADELVSSETAEGIEGTRELPAQGESKPVAAATAPAAAPAPSLDPQVRAMRDQMAAENERIAQKASELDKQRESLSTIIDHEYYLENAPKSYRSWLEAMRGEKISDNDFQSETADFITLMSSEVLGVPLSDEVKSRIESQLTRRQLSAYKAKATRKEMAEVNRREAIRVQGEWDHAAAVLSNQFRQEVTAKSYPWLAVEDNPGSIVVDVIQSAQRRDGTKLSWKEAAKQANDYLKINASGYYDKRKHLLGASSTGKPIEQDKAKQEVRTGRPPGPSQVTRTPVGPSPDQLPVVQPRFKIGSAWSNEKHRRNTLKSFEGKFKPEP